MLKTTRPNGEMLTLPKDKMPEVVLELHGGGINELSTRKAMLSADKLRAGAEIKINGYKLQLVEA